MSAIGRTSEARAGWAMSIPALAAILLFFVLPAIASLFLSFTDFDIYALADRANLRFVGFGNYEQLFADRVFWKSFGNTFVYCLVVVPGSVFLGLGLALLIVVLAVVKPF